MTLLVYPPNKLRVCASHSFTVKKVVAKFTHNLIGSSGLCEFLEVACYIKAWCHFSRGDLMRRYDPNESSRRRLRMFLEFGPFLGLCMRRW